MTVRRNREARKARRERPTLVLLCVLCVLCGSFLLSAQQQPPPKPSFQASVEVTSLDVSVVDDRGKPLTDLAPADFTVRIDGAPRRVVSAEWIPLTEPAGVMPPPPPDGYSTNESATGGRLIILGEPVLVHDLRHDRPAVPRCHGLHDAAPVAVSEQIDPEQQEQSSACVRGFSEIN